MLFRQKKNWIIVSYRWDLFIKQELCLERWSLSIMINHHNFREIFLWRSSSTFAVNNFLGYRVGMRYMNLFLFILKYWSLIMDEEKRLFNVETFILVWKFLLYFYRTDAWSDHTHDYQSTINWTKFCTKSNRSD